MLQSFIELVIPCFHALLSSLSSLGKFIISRLDEEVVDMSERRGSLVLPCRSRMYSSSLPEGTGRSAPSRNASRFVYDGRVVEVRSSGEDQRLHCRQNLSYA